MAKLGAAVDFDPFAKPAPMTLGAPVDFDPFAEPGPPEERELNLPPLEGQPAAGIPLPPERERPIPVPTPRPEAQPSGWERTVEALGDIPEAVLRGYYGAKTGANILGVETGRVSPEEAAANIAENIKKRKEVAMPETVRKGMEELQKAKGWEETFTALKNHPDVLPSVLGESAAASLVSTATGLIGALTGAAVGSVVPVVGTAAGATAGLVAGVGAGSAATEYASTLNDFLTSQGYDTSDAEQLKAAFSNPSVMAAARKDAAIRGVAVGAFDALTAGVAGKLFAPVKQALGKGAVGAIAGTTAEIGTQALGGAGGEAAAQLGTKGEITSPSDIALEAAGELIPGLGEIAISKLTGASPTAKPRVIAEETPEVAPEAPAVQPSPEQPVEAPGAAPSSPPPEAAAPEVTPEAAPEAKPIPAEEDIKILKGAGYGIEDIISMSPREVKAEVKDAKEAQVEPVDLTPEDLAVIKSAQPTKLGEPLEVPPESLFPAEEAPAPEAAPVAPATRATELVKEGVAPIEAMKQAGAEPIAPAPEAAPAPAAEIAPAAEAPPVFEILPEPVPSKEAVPRVPTKLPFAVNGTETQVKVGNSYLPARYVAVDADKIKATMGSAINQFRDRERKVSEKQIEEIANDPDWNQLNVAPIMDFGAPTLDSKGYIVGGNGRFEGLSRAYDRGTANNYKRLMAENAGRFGIDPSEIAKMKKPVLMRVIEADIDTKKLALSSNEGSGLKMSRLEQARVDAERLPDISNLKVNETGDISASGNKDIIQSWTKDMPTVDIGTLVDKNGLLSQEGMQRLRNAIMFKAYGDAPALDRIVDSLDSGSKNLAAALNRASLKIAKVKDAIASGDLYPLDITPDLLQATEKFEQLRQSGQKIKDYLDQGEMFGSDISSDARKILQFFGDHMRSPKAMSDLINRYYDKVEAAGNPRQVGMLEEQAVPVKSNLIDSSLTEARKVLPKGEAELPFGVAEETPAEEAPAPKAEAELPMEEAPPAPATEAAPEPEVKAAAPVLAISKEPSKAKESPKGMVDWLNSKEQFSKSPNMPQEYLDVLAEWATMLGIKNKIHLMHDSKDTLNFDFSPAKQKKRLDKTVGGERIYYPKKKATIIRIKKIEPRKSYNLEIIAHELGHAFESEMWANSSKEEREAVLSDYRKFLKENKTKNIEDYIKALRPHVTGKLSQISPSFRKAGAENLKPYWRSFDEYFADQVAKYMMSEQRPQTIVGKYFARIADGLKRLYNSLAGMSGKASKSMKEYIDRRVNEADNILDAEPSSMETAIDEEPIVNESRSSLSQETIDKLNKLNEETGMRKDIKPEGPKAPVETNLDKFRAVIQDKAAYLSKVQEDIERKRNAPLPDSLNVYSTLMTMPGRISERIHDLNKDEFDPILKKLIEFKMTPDELHLDRLALHALERNPDMAERDPERFGGPEGGGSGITNGAAQKILEEHEPRRAQFDELHPMLQKIIDNDIDRRVEAGIMSEEEAKDNRGKYKYYAPLRGFAERDFENDFPFQQYNIGRGVSLTKDEYKKAFGRNSLPDNVIYNIFMQAEEGIYRIERNRAVKTLRRLAEKYPIPELWTTGKMKQKKVIGEDGLVKYEMDQSVGPNTIVGKVGGQPFYIDINNEAIADAFNRAGPVAMAKWFEPIAKVTRGWAQLQTSKNPAFMATNFQRDVGEALFYTYGQDPALAAEFLKSLPEALSITTKASFGEMTAEEKALYDEFRKSGAKISYNAIQDAAERGANWELQFDNINPAKWNTLSGKAKIATRKAFNSVVNGLERLASPFEDGVRAAVYIGARKVMKPEFYKLSQAERNAMTPEQKAAYNKYTPQQAARFAQEATVNFFRKGKWSPYLNGLYAFFNASTQGAYTGLRLLKRSRRARLAWLSLIPLSFMSTLRNLGMSDDDPTQKGRKMYNNIPEWERQNYVIIKTGKGEKDYIKFRLPSILTIPWYMGEQAALIMTGQQKAAMSAGNMFGHAIDAFNPLGSGSIVSAIAPTILDPIADIMMNKKYSGAPIHPKPEPWNQGIPNSEQKFSTTAPWASYISKALYKGSLGNIDIYPGDAEHVADWMFSGLAKNSGNVFNFMNDVRQGKDAKIADLPIVKTFAPSSWSPATRYYELHDAVDSKVNRLRSLANEIVKTKSPEKLKEFRELSAGTGIYFDGQKANTSGNDVLQTMRNSDSLLKSLREQSLAVQSDNKLSPLAKQKKLDDIKLKMERVMVSAGRQMSIFDPRPAFAPLSSLLNK